MGVCRALTTLGLAAACAGATVLATGEARQLRRKLHRGVIKPAQVTLP